MYENVRRFFQSLWKCAASVCRLGRDLQARRRVCAGLGVTSYSIYSQQVKTFKKTKGMCVVPTHTLIIDAYTQQ